MKRKKYNFIFSIGEACSCTQALRQQGLQNASYPFDWLYGSTFVERCKILADEFKYFIRKEDLEFAYSYDVSGLTSDAYHNKLNGIIFNHDFSNSLEFEEAYPLVKEKYDRRIKRLLEKIKNSKSVLAVYLETPTTGHSEISNQEIFQGYSILREKFGDKISLLYIKNNKGETVIEEFENGKIIKVIGDYKDYDSELDYQVKRLEIIAIFCKLGLNNWFNVYTKKFLRSLIKRLIYSEELKQKCVKYFKL